MADAPFKTFLDGVSGGGERAYASEVRDAMVAARQQRNVYMVLLASVRDDYIELYQFLM